MNAIDGLMSAANEIEAKLDYRFNDRTLLMTAFVHRSYLNEYRDALQHNERLEFLGDSVLGMLMAEYLYRQLPEAPEGDLSYLRSRLVEASSCMSYVQKLDISKYMLLGKGERMNDGRGRESILADLFEAIVGAIYLDGGVDAARHFLFRNFTTEVLEIIKTPLKNWKALLQAYSQKNFQEPPQYQIIDETGPDHSKIFTIAIFIHGEEMGRGIGASKKEAQQAAAADAYARINPQELM